MLAGLEPTDRLMGKFANLSTKVSLFQAMNKANQYLAAAAGREYLDSLMRAKAGKGVLGKLPGRKSWAEKSLRDFYINPNV